MDLLCDTSPFFKAAFTKDFKESSEKAMSLPEDDVDTFERFACWLYNQDIKLSGYDTNEGADERYMQLAMLYTLADKLVVTGLKNEAIKNLIETRSKAGHPPQQPIVTHGYSNSRENSSLRKFIVACHVWHIGYKWYDYDGTPGKLLEIPEFAVDLVIAMAKRVSGTVKSSPLLGDVSAYYEDVEEEVDVSKV